MMRPLLILLLACPCVLWGAGVISGDKPTPAEKPGAGDVQVGPAVEAPETPGPKTPLAKPAGKPGVYPVYEADGRWLIIDREPDVKKRHIRAGADVVLIGSKGIEVFRVQRSTKTWIAACEKNRAAPRIAYLLTARKASKFQAVGTPIIALLLPKGRSFDTKSAWFYALKNEVVEDTYKKLQDSIGEAVVADLKSGAFQIDAGDEAGHALAGNPKPENIQMKIDFGTKIRFQGVPDAFLLVEGTQISKTYRRCMRLYAGRRAVGRCSEMPHELLVETRQMEFVAYDPAKRGRPYIFAYTVREPLWGHERWGFILADEGPQLFLRDALDPRCREGF